MSLFDIPVSSSLVEAYPEGTPFRLMSVVYDGKVPTDFGENDKATVTVEPPGGGDATEYAVFGTLARMSKGIEPTDLPAMVSLGTDGRRKIWTKG
jgi:hypothetical protein